MSCKQAMCESEFQRCLGTVSVVIRVTVLCSKITFQLGTVAVGPRSSWTTEGRLFGLCKTERSGAEFRAVATGYWLSLEGMEFPKTGLGLGVGDNSGDRQLPSMSQVLGSIPSTAQNRYSCAPNPALRRLRPKGSSRSAWDTSETLPSGDVLTPSGLI